MGKQLTYGIPARYHVVLVEWLGGLFFDGRRSFARDSFTGHSSLYCGESRGEYILYLSVIKSPLSAHLPAWQVSLSSHPDKDFATVVMDLVHVITHITFIVFILRLWYALHLRQLRLHYMEVYLGQVEVNKSGVFSRQKCMWTSHAVLFFAC